MLKPTSQRPLGTSVSSLSSPRNHMDRWIPSEHVHQHNIFWEILLASFTQVANLSGFRFPHAFVSFRQCESQTCLRTMKAMVSSSYKWYVSDLDFATVCSHLRQKVFGFRNQASNDNQKSGNWWKLPEFQPINYSAGYPGCCLTVNHRNRDLWDLSDLKCIWNILAKQNQKYQWSWKQTSKIIQSTKIMRYVNRHYHRKTSWNKHWFLLWGGLGIPHFLRNPMVKSSPSNLPLHPAEPSERHLLSEPLQRGWLAGPDWRTKYWEGPPDAAWNQLGTTPEKTWEKQHGIQGFVNVPIFGILDTTLKNGHWWYTDFGWVMWNPKVPYSPIAQCFSLVVPRVKRKVTGGIISTSWLVVQCTCVISSGWSCNNMF